jgi:hypothetical protein
MPAVAMGGTVRVLTMDSAVLGLAALRCGCCTVPVFRQDIALEDAIGSHAGSFAASVRVTNSIPLGCSLPCTVATKHICETLKVRVQSPAKPNICAVRVLFDGILQLPL